MSTCHRCHGSGETAAYDDHGTPLRERDGQWVTRDCPNCAGLGATVSTWPGEDPDFARKYERENPR